ncbi:uncharacterized protein LOC126788983 [Argentina anserina]|uniref:uncharacterized protein LOC126788983 n=1 Tax=Argentina anserina TaxID=57926 RepID=UPI00217666F8|nr:uncharacterized protein LOC126788983 [Potentilla anserina]XP_050370982.1 uncharacterized protein LOC126788983 [Potentilla anserina]XP_050370984.1 uncharacterized protein LOC126788983 [Potentilla anserina]XP_050370985.1 uncharacterized protein LOC126788983 [Potentilla anserina]
MGSACCVAARERSHPNRTRNETLRRNALYSPSWSFRYDNRRRVAGEIDTSYRASRGTSRTASMELKGALSSERGNFSDLGSPLENFGTPISQKSPVHGGICTSLRTPSSDLSMMSNYSPDVKNLAESPGIEDSAALNPSPKTVSIPTAEPSPAPSYPLFSNSTPSRRARRSPGHQLLRQISDSRILGLKSPNDNSISEGRQSFVLSTCSNDLATGSQAGSSDGWSMRTFSELVASSRRERWSFDSERFGSMHGKLSGCSSRFSCSPSVDMQSCGVCSKLLTERTSWSIQKIIASSDISVAAVLVCGHVYHAECLETMTLEINRYDPLCPICMVGEKQVWKIARKAMRSESEKARNHKISKNRVVDSYLDGEYDVFDNQNTDRKGKVLAKVEPSSSSRNSTKPFLKRHFSLGSKWSGSLSENDSARKKGFWARYRKD